MLLPAEHGSWAWLLIPFGVGTAVSGQFSLPVGLVGLGGLAAFLLRQPAGMWLRAQQGKASRAAGQTAVRWTLLLLTVALACLLGLLALGRWLLLWLLLPPLLILGGYLLLMRQRPAAIRSLGMELAGAAILALLAPAALLAATNQLTGLAWLLWGLLAGQNMLGALYVRVRIADTHQRPSPRWRIFGVHLLVLLLLGVVWWWGKTAVSFPALLPFLFFALRMGWAAMQPRPVENIKRFGFLETAVELLGGIHFSWGIEG